MMYAWGQFVDHDLDLEQQGIPSPATDISVTVPVDDQVLEPGSPIPITRVAIDPDTGVEGSPATAINTITGCYYQINPPGSTNLSDCYSMFGSRSPLKRFEADSTANEGQELAEVQATSKRREPDQPDQTVLDLYLRARAIAVGR